MSLLNRNEKYPMFMPDGTKIEQTVYLKEVLKHPRITVGEYSYYHNFEILRNYAEALAPYLFELSLDKLIIGKFVQIAHGVRFITSSANHKTSGFSTYPFMNFMMTSQTTREDIKEMFEEAPDKGDIVVGNDVWIGLEATIMPGVKIGDGAIIGAKSLVTRDVKPYTVVAGNPAKTIKKRFSKEEIDSLQKIQWWNWDIKTIEKNYRVITGNSIDELLVLSKTL